MLCVHCSRVVSGEFRHPEAKAIINRLMYFIGPSTPIGAPLPNAQISGVAKVARLLRKQKA